MIASHIIINPLNSVIMTAKKSAIRDIKESLRNQGKCFLAFRQELNPIMDRLVSEQLKAQETIAHKV